MDKNKLIKLREIGYKVLAVCGTCENSIFENNNTFGICKVFSYDHLKHKRNMPLSITRYGVCDYKGYRPKVEGDLLIFVDHLNHDKI